MKNNRQRIAAVAMAGIGALALAMPALAEPAPAPQPSAARGAAIAATWLAGETNDGIFRYLGSPDWGFTTDAAFAYAGAGLGTTLGGPTLDALKANAAAIVDPGGVTSVSGASKLGITAAIYGENARSFGGVDVVAALESLLVTTGPDTGRYADDGDASIGTANAFAQSYAVIAASRLGVGAQSSVDYLALQQCPGGGFRLLAQPTACTDGAEGDVDTTAVAIAAFEAAEAAGLTLPAMSLADATGFLVVNQNADGSFNSSGQWSFKNTNTTGIAAQSLRSQGETGAADFAAEYLLGQQLLCSFPVEAQGAFPYSEFDYADAVTAGGLPAGNEDGFRRATAQALLALGSPSLAVLTSADRAVEGEFVCSGSPTTTTTTTTTVPGSTTTSTTTSTTSTTSTSTTVAPTSTTGATSTTQYNVSVNNDRDDNVSVAGRSTTRSGTRSGSALAVTGSTTSPFVTTGAALFLVGLTLSAAGFRLRNRAA